jgi:hypothetical protein
MTLPLWGSLQKAQDDSETIEDAITRLIVEHESDPTAHLGTGESLEQHKSESIVDHPQGSILPDKISVTDLSFDTTFESLDGFDVTSGVTNPDWPGVEFSIYDGGGDLRTLKANLLGLIASPSISYDVLFDTYFYVDSEDSLEIINVGLTNNTQTGRYLGFRITGGQIYGYANYGSGEHLTSSLHTLSGVSVVFVRVYYDYTGGVIYFYVNGELEGTLQPDAAVAIDSQFHIHCVDNGAESTVFRVFRLTFSRSI